MKNLMQKMVKVETFNRILRFLKAANQIGNFPQIILYLEENLMMVNLFNVSQSGECKS